MAEEENKQRCHTGAPIWMTTFADLMSLLLCFFVLLLSFSNMDQQKYKIVAGSMEKAFGIQKQMPIMDTPRGREMLSRDFKTVPFDIQTKIMDLISEEIGAGLVDAEAAPDYLTLRVKDSIAFDSGRADIRPEFLPLLDKFGRILKEMDVAVTVSGHTDNVPVRKGGKFESNWGLSSARAVKIVEYWTEKFLYPADRLAAVGYAEGQPIAGNDTPEERAKNRRVEFKIRPLKKELPLGQMDFITQ